MEVKGPTVRLRPERTVLLQRINRADGLRFIASDPRDVLGTSITQVTDLHALKNEGIFNLFIHTLKITCRPNSACGACKKFTGEVVDVFMWTRAYS